MRRPAIAMIVVVVGACSPSKPAPPRPGPHDARIEFASTHIRFADAGPDAAPPPAPARLAAYLHLLVADLYVAELIRMFPGAPKGTVFDSLRYAWYTPMFDLAQLATWVDAAGREVAGRGEVDEAVRGYVEAAQRVLPGLLGLASYYDDRRFVDDEFDRGRRESALVAAASEALAAARGELWSRVIVEWREVARDRPDSPRAVVGAAYEACMRVGGVLAAKGRDDALHAAVSACRRAIAPVAALPEPIRHGFDHALRDAAVALGDIAARGATLYDASRSIADLTGDYLALWPLLPEAPAEQAAP